MDRTRGDDRGQAFTLEGFVASVVILTAILLALQSVVLTPTTGGSVDREVQQQLRTKATDVLRVSASNFSDCRSTCPIESRDLSYVIRFWNGTQAFNEDTWAYAVDDDIGYGSNEPLYKNGTIFGRALNGSFTQEGFVYNVIVEYRDPTSPNSSRTARLVYRGVPSNDAVTTEFTVTLYDNQTMTGPGRPTGPSPPCPERTLENVSATQGATACYYAIPEANAFGGNDPDLDGDSPIYNIVEVRVVVW